MEEYPKGPVQVYVVPPDPVKFIGYNKHTGEFVMILGVGNGFMTTLAVTIFEQVPAVTINEYVPFAAICTLGILGF